MSDENGELRSQKLLENTLREMVASVKIQEIK